MPTTAFHSLIAPDQPQYLLQSYGRSHALGWRGEPDEITKAYNLFANFDFDDSTALSRERPPARLVTISPRLSFINTTPVRIKTCLARWFRVMALHQDLPRADLYDPVTDTFADSPHEAEAARLADLATTTFMRDHIKVETFVPEADAFIVDEIETPFAATETTWSPYDPGYSGADDSA